MQNDVEPFYIRVLSPEGNIFEVCTKLWPPLEKIMLKGVWNTALALEGQAAIQISQKRIL